MKICQMRFLLAVPVLAVALGGAAGAHDEDAPCSQALLHGDYAFTITGQIFSPGKPVVTRQGVAMTDFHGDGTLTQTDFVMQYPDKGGGSSPVPGEPDSLTQFNTGEQGSYQVFADCTGEMEIDFPPLGEGGAVIKARFVLSRDGDTIHTVVYFAQPPGAPGPVPAMIQSEGHRLFRRSRAG
jgi:hypothetical protein